MKIIFLTLAMFLTKSKASGGGEKKSVHFKVHVPEIIKHHMHTKVVFIHVHETKPDHHKNHNEESHVEDWTSYNSYNYNNGLEENNAGGYHHRKKQKTNLTPYDDYMPMNEDNYRPYEPKPGVDDPENYLSNDPQSENPLGLFGPPIDPEELDPRSPNANGMMQPPTPQYAIHEELDEEPPEDDMGYGRVHESGYRRGMKTETGHVISKDLKKFYDKENQEEDFTRGGHENESYSKFGNHGYRGNYDKEIGLEQRTGHKRADRRRFLVARMVLR